MSSLKGGGIKNLQRKCIISCSVPCQKAEIETIKKKDPLEPIFITKKVTPYYYTCGFIFTLIVFILSSTGAFILWGTDIYHTTILKVLTLQDGGLIYGFWKKPNFDTWIRIYPFNYTNIDRIGDEVPHLEELGPYVFRERVEKVNVVFNNDGTLTYSENRTHEFDEVASNGSLLDFIYTPNVPFISAAAAGSRQSIFSQMGLGAILAGLDTRPFLPVTIEDFVMGFDDSFSLVARRISHILKGSEPPRFGLLESRNGLSYERVTIGTGVPNLNNLGVVSRYDGVASLNYWKTSECNTITGGDGTIFPGNVVQESTRLYIYVKGFCRRIPIEYYGEEVLLQSFPVKRFELPSNIFNFGPEDKENDCYCRENVCPPTGTFSTSVCSFGAPMLISFPHFLHGEPELITNVTGLAPDVEKHRFYFDVHKIFGVPLGGKSRFQVNVQVRHCPFLNGLNSIRNGTVLPIAWIEIEIGELSEDVHSLIYHATYTVSYLETVLSWSSLLLTFISSARLVYYLFFQ